MSSALENSRGLVQSKIFLGGHNSESVGVTHASSPALNTDDGIALVENTELDGIHDTPLETTIDVFLPRGRLEVGLGLWEVEGVHASVEVGVSRSPFVAGNHDDRANRPILGDKSGGGSTSNSQLQLISHLCSMRAHLVVKTRMAPAFCSKLALTAAIAQVSVVGHGTGASLLSSSKALTYGIATSASRHVSCMRVTASTG